MDLSGDDLLLLLCLLAFAFSILSLAEWNHRRQLKRRCGCGHVKKEHNLYLGPCGYHELIGGLSFHCHCEEYHDWSQVTS